MDVLLHHQSCYTSAHLHQGFRGHTAQLPVLPQSLDQSSLTLQDFQCLLKTSDLSCMTACTLCVGLCLRYALLLNLCEIFEDGIQLCLNTRAVSRILGRAFVELLGLFDLVLDRLLLCCPLNFVIPAHCRVLIHCRLFFELQARNCFRHVRFDGLQQPDNTSCCSRCSIVRSIGGIVFPKHLHGQFHTFQTLGLLGSVSSVGFLLLLPQFV